MMERKDIFRTVLLIFIILIFKSTDVFTSESEDDDVEMISQVLSDNSLSSDDLDVPLVERSCSCVEEIQTLRRLLDELRGEFTYYKETEIHRQHRLDQRIQLIIQGLKTNQTEEMQMHLKYIQEHIIDESVLQRISESLWVALQAEETTSTDNYLFLVYRKLQKNSTPGLYMPFFQAYFNSLDDSDKLNDVETLSSIMNEFEVTLRESKPIQLGWWSKETETFFLHRIHVHILKLLAMVGQDPDWNSMQTNIPSVHDRGSYRSTDMTTAFSKLSKLEVYNVIVDTFESELAGELLSSIQLKYLLKIYASSATISRSFEGQFDEVYSQEDWALWKQIFGKKFILDSIDRDILSKVTWNQTDVATIGLKYIENWGTFFDFHGNPEDDILFGHIAEVFLHAIQNNVMTYDPMGSKYWELIQEFQRIPDIFIKYPFLMDDVKSGVFEKYANNPSNFQAAVGFTKNLVPALKYPALKQLISTMRENQHLNGNLAFQVGEVLFNNNLHTDPIWTELPEQVQLIMGPSRFELTWKVSAPAPGGEALWYEITCSEDFAVELLPLPRETLVEGSQNKWKFVTATGGNFVIQLADFPLRGGLVLATAENGTKYARHVKNSRDRKNGIHFIFEPRLSANGDAFTLNRPALDFDYVQDELPMEIQVLYADQNVPYNIGFGNEAEVARVAEFIVAKWTE